MRWPEVFATAILAAAVAFTFYLAETEGMRKAGQCGTPLRAERCAP